MNLILDYWNVTMGDRGFNFVVLNSPGVVAVAMSTRVVASKASMLFRLSCITPVTPSRTMIFTTAIVPLPFIPWESMMAAHSRPGSEELESIRELLDYIPRSIWVSSSLSAS